jgi:hypothetical protein
VTRVAWPTVGDIIQRSWRAIGGTVVVDHIA